MSIMLMILVTLLGCSKEPPTKEELLKFETENQKFLDSVKKMSDLVLSSDFKIDGVEVVYVQAGEIYYQWLGHVLIRFVGSGKSPDQDLGVSFIADFNDFNLDNLKAYYGGYEVLPIIDKWENYINDYLVKEDRYIDRYILPLSKEQRKRLADVMKSWIKDPTIPGPYSFRRNSCTALLLRLLASVEEKINGDEVVFPVEVVPYLKSVGKINYRYERLDKSNYIELQNKMVKLEKYGQ